MKFILSSKKLFNSLKTLDVACDNQIVEVEYEDSILTLRTERDSVFLRAEPIGKGSFRQTTFGSWHFLKATLEKAPEMPIVLTVDDNQLEVTFQY